MKSYVLYITTAIAMIFLSAPAVFAGEPDTLDGRIGIGFIVIDSADNLNPSSSEKYIDSLDTAAERKTTILPMILPAATWDIGEPEQVKLYFGTEPPLDEVGGFALNLGGTYNIGGVGLFDAGIFFTPFEKAWEKSIRHRC